MKYWWVTQDNSYNDLVLEAMMFALRLVANSGGKLATETIISHSIKHFLKTMTINVGGPSLL
jgi:hypothetical protein